MKRAIISAVAVTFGLIAMTSAFAMPASISISFDKAGTTSNEKTVAFDLIFANKNDKNAYVYIISNQTAEVRGRLPGRNVPYQVINWDNLSLNNLYPLPPPSSRWLASHN